MGLEVNNNPSLSIDEIRPLPSQSRAETNRLFAEAKRDVTGTKWGRPCRCAGHPRPHTHHPCAIDVAVKLPIIEGALTIVNRAQADALAGRGHARRSMWSEGTVFN